jgi:WD40 repeat protein
MHTAAITEISIDAANRFLVTASFDKTVRLWELPSGRLLRVLRVPIGEGSDGKLYSVAISPDGGTIAVGGFTASAREGGSNIYLFDRETGTLIKRIVGLPNAVTYLTYSHNGQYLAATLGDNGFRIYSSESYALAGEDQACGDSGLSADFDRVGRLVTACYDGFIRLYAPVGSGPIQLLFKRKVPNGRPASVKFSPDGSRVAVGLGDSVKVAVLSAQDLTPLYTPDTSGVSNGDLAKVAWSADGRTLYAGGLYVDPSLSASSRVIRAWTDGGRGDHRDVEAARDRITHMLPLSDGGIIYSSADPAFGIIDGRVRRTVFVVAQKADYRAGQSSFLTSSDGTGIQFSYELFGQAPAHFSVTSRRLDMGTAANTDWRAPVTKAKGMVVTDWRETASPELNGKALTLLPKEISRALAIAPDDRSFLIGASWSLYLFDRMGNRLWRVPAPDTTWAVNVTGDGKTAVAAFSDGTIRWYRMEDGQELLAFYPSADRKRWVNWTPSGYYDASPGAEDLIGWHLNNGRDMAADFFPIKQVKSFFHRPDVVAEMLKAQGETQAIKVANGVSGRQDQRVEVGKVLPPVVDILSPPDGAERVGGEIFVRFRTRTPTGEPVISVRALVDGRPAQTKETARVATGRGSNIIEMKVFVEGAANQISIVAQNKYSASVPASVEVHRNRLKL